MLKKLGLPAMLVGALLSFSSGSAVAAEHGEHGGHAGGTVGRSSQRFSGGHQEHYENRGHYDRDDHYRRGYYYGGPAFSFGFYGAPNAYGYAPYSYGPKYCGYYDQWGNWVQSPGCYSAPYGY
jgi:hypothetical protein